MFYMKTGEEMELKSDLNNQKCFYDMFATYQERAEQ